MEVLPGYSREKGGRVVGTGGTITCLAAIAQRMKKYSSRNITGFSLPMVKVEEIWGWLKIRNPRQRRGLAGLEPGREDVIASGTCIVLNVMKNLGRGKVVACDAGILEGILLTG